MDHVAAALGVSERVACRVLGQHRSTRRRAPSGPDDEAALTAGTVSLARARGRYGHRRITALPRADGWQVNARRVERVWRLEALRVPPRQPGRGRLWLNDGPCARLRPERPNHARAHDFVEDRTREGRKFRMPCVVGGFTREALRIRVARRPSSPGAIDVLSDLFVARGAPVFVRSDNGGEFTAAAVQDWISKVGAGTAHAAPGSPWENGCVESFNGKPRDELLDGEAFNTLAEARVPIERWRRHHNTARPHSALNYRPPAPEVVLPVGPAAANGSGSTGSPQPRVPTVH